MNKSKIRNKILKLRKSNFNNNFKINTDNFFSFLKLNNYNSKNIGGYYPINYEIDDIDILRILKKKNITFHYQLLKKIIRWIFLSGQITIH